MEEWQKEKLHDFLGYGDPSAPLWFIGVEEGLGGATIEGEDDKNIDARCKWQPVMDMWEAHLAIVERGAPIDISKPRKGSMTVWLWVSRIARAYYGATDWADLEKARHYLRTRLGRMSVKETFLTELSPMPSGKLSPEESLRPSQLRDRRWSTLRRHLNEGPPKVVVCYGIGRAAKFQEFLQIPRWVPISPKVSKAPNSPHYLVPFFGNGQMSFDVISPLIAHDAFPRASAVRRRSADIAAAIIDPHQL